VSGSSNGQSYICFITITDTVLSEILVSIGKVILQTNKKQNTNKQTKTHPSA